MIHAVSAHLKSSSIVFKSRVRGLLVPSRLQGPSLVLGSLGEGNTQLEQLGDDGGKVLEEEVIVLGILLDEWLELLVLDQSVVRGQHHQGLAGFVLVLITWLAGVGVACLDRKCDSATVIAYLLGTIPLLPLPGLLQQEAVVVVGEDGWRKGPRAIEAGSVRVATTQSVGTGQSDDFLIVETHAVEDIAQVVGALGTIGQATVRSAGGHVTVGTARSERNDRTLHLLDGSDATEDPEVGIGDPWKLGYDGSVSKAGLRRGVRSPSGRGRQG
jgi:hypothetical protein